MSRLRVLLVMLSFTLLTIIITSGLNAYAATYYVQQSGGDDSNDGTSPATPWRNCPGMETYAGAGTLSPGDTVYFDSGDTWLVTGTQGLYLVGGVTYIGDYWGSGMRAEIKANANLEAGVIRFRDHATDATVFKGFNVNCNNKVTSGIDINHRYWQLMNGALKRVENCEVHHVSSRQSSGQYKYGIIISNHGGVGGYAENVQIIDCIIHDISRDGICLYPGDANADCRIKNITVRGCEVYNTGQDPDYGAGAGLLVKGYVQGAYLEYNYVHSTKGAGIFVNGNENNHHGVGPTSIHIRYNIVSTPTIHGCIRIYDKGADPKDIKIYGNIVMNNTMTGGLSLEGNSGTLKLLVYNNTFYESFVRFTNHSSTINTLEFKNNIIYCTTAVPLMANSGNIKQHSNNIYYRGGGSIVIIGNQNYTASNVGSWESTAVSSNPMFKDSSMLPSGFDVAYDTDLRPNTDGLAIIGEGSPAKDSGAVLESPYDGSINSVLRVTVDGWDRGAYELNVSERPEPPSNLRVVESR